MSSSSGLRDVSRRAIRAETSATALALFAERGYDATTVDAIAAAVGMSQRTFFRYFASKDDLVLETWDQMAEGLLERLGERPGGELPWTSLRRSFDGITDDVADPRQRERREMLHRLVVSSPALLAAYLGHHEQTQRAMTTLLLERSGGTASPAITRALVGAAFACLQAAFEVEVVDDGGSNLGRALDEVMTALRPAAS